MNLWYPVDVGVWIVCQLHHWTVEVAHADTQVLGRVLEHNGEDDGGLFGNGVHELAVQFLVVAAILGVVLELAA